MSKRRVKMPLNNVDWTSLSDVELLCCALGDGNVVIKVAGRPNYNIVRLSRRDLWDRPGVEIVSMPITEANMRELPDE